MATSRPEDRKASERRGHRSETVAAFWLRLKGYRILARGLKSPVGEIDIVARRGNVLAFVEVKARRQVTAAAEALGQRQFGRVARSASLFLAEHPRHAACAVRFDAVLVGGLWPRHLPDVWQPPE